MHEKLIAKIDLTYPDEYDQLHSEVIKTGKNLSDHQVEAAIIEYIANTDFSKHLLYDFEYQADSDTIKDWMRLCREEYTKLTIKDPMCDEDLIIGMFKSDNKYTNYANLHIMYERRYLENE